MEPVDVEYVNELGEILYVDKLASGKFASFKLGADGFGKRFNKRTLIPQDIIMSAERDLKHYAEEHGCIERKKIRDFSRKRKNLKYLYRAYIEALKENRGQ